MAERQLSLLPSVRRTAVFSECGTYRYLLTRCWSLDEADEPTLGDVAWIMLNPSTADANQDDATLRRCIDFSKRWGYGGLLVVNLFGLVSTDPRALLSHPDPIGPDNDQHVRNAIAVASLVVCAWGTHGTLLERGDRMREQLLRWGVVPKALGFTKNGQPKHPVRLAKRTRLVFDNDRPRSRA